MATQVKEKFGGLRFYVSSAMSKLKDRLKRKKFLASGKVKK